MHDCMTGVLADQKNTKVTKTPEKKGKQTISRKKEKQDQENRNFCLFMQTMARKCLICLCQTLLPNCFYGFFEVQKPQNFPGAASPNHGAAKLAPVLHVGLARYARKI